MSATGRVAAGRKTIAIFTTWSPNNPDATGMNPITYLLEGLSARDGSDLWDFSSTGTTSNDPVSGDIPLVPQVFSRTAR
jgi:hypothetical protein